MGPWRWRWRWLTLPSTPILRLWRRWRTSWGKRRRKEPAVCALVVATTIRGKDDSRKGTEMKLATIAIPQEEAAKAFVEYRAAVRSAKTARANSEDAQIARCY